MTTREVLEAAKSLISDEDKWCQGRLYCDDAYCAMGAVEKVSGECCLKSQAYVALVWAIGGSVAGYNDSHNHACVIELFDRAIEKVS